MSKHITNDPTLEARFWSKVDKGDPGDCWIWIAGKAHNGYGLFWKDRKQQRAHRIAWEMAHGPIPDGYLICHHCDNPGCVNVNHLFLGTQRDNILDCSRKGRLKTLRGSDAIGAKLSDVDVIRIRGLYKTGKYSQAELGGQYDVTQGCIWLIVNGINWNHLCDPTT